MSGEREAEVTSSEEGWGERVGGIPVACFLAVLAGLQEAFLQKLLVGLTSQLAGVLWTWPESAEQETRLLGRGSAQRSGLCQLLASYQLTALAFLLLKFK